MQLVGTTLTHSFHHAACVDPYQQWGEKCKVCPDSSDRKKGQSPTHVSHRCTSCYVLHFSNHEEK